MGLVVPRTLRFHSSHIQTLTYHHLPPGPSPITTRLAMHQEKASKRAAKEDKAEAGAVPAYLIDRENVNRAKVRILG